MTNLKLKNIFLSGWKLFPVVLVFFPLWVNATTYYVDSSRPDDSGNGLTQAAAWKTIEKVNSSTFQPGDNILFKRGQSWHEQLTVPSSGSAGDPITFGAYGTGTNPKIYRTDTYNNWWEEGFLPSNDPQRPNGVLNGGMEAYSIGSPNDTIQYGGGWGWWNISTDPTGSIKVDPAGHSGNCVKLDGKNTGSRWSGNRIEFYQYPTFTGGKTYYLSVWGKRETSDNNILFLIIRDTSASPNRYLDSSGVWQTNNSLVMDWSGSAVGEWVKKTITFTAYGTGNRDITFDFYNYGNSASYIDDVYLVEGTGPSPVKVWGGTILGNTDFGGILRDGKRVYTYENVPRVWPAFIAQGYFSAPWAAGVFFYRSDTGNPGPMEVGSRVNAILIREKSYIVIDGIDAIGPAGDVSPYGSYKSGVDDEATLGYVLIQIDKYADNIVIKNSEISDANGVGIWSGNTTTNIYYQNLDSHDNKTTGIYLNSQGGSVTNCKVYDNGRLATDGGDMGGIGSYQGGNLLISGNEVYHNAPDDQSADFEISVVSPTNPFNITKNYVHDCIQGCIQIVGGGDNSVISYNLINKYGTSTTNVYNPGSHSGIVLGGGAGPGVKNAKILNNVIAAGAKTGNNGMEFNGGGGSYDWPTEGGISFSYDDSNAVVKNNIFFNNANRDIYVHNGASIAGAVFDNNIYYRQNYTDNWWIQGYSYNSLASWQSTFSQDAHSSTSNPFFTNASGNFSRASDFQLQSNSPAKDTGANVGLTTDFAGTSVPQNSVPDIGTYEYFITYSAADINRDESINLTDFNILKLDFLKLAAALANPRSDINGDGQVTVKDVGILMSGWR